MARRLVVLGFVLMLQFHPAPALIHREIGGNVSGTGGGGGNPLPPGPILVDPGFTEEEPYRNPDLGPLGVVLSNGEFQIAVTDLEIPGRGLPFQLTRTYRSKQSDVRGPLGFGWHLSYDETLVIGTYRDPGLKSHPAIQWTLGNGWRQLWVDGDGTGYRPQGGLYGKLRPLATGLGYQVRTPDGTVRTFGRSFVRPPGSTLVWVLTRIEDRNGNALTFQIRPAASPGAGVLESVTDTLGRAVTFAYDGSDRLTAVTDFTGRRVEYSYDAFDRRKFVHGPIHFDGGDRRALQRGEQHPPQ